MWFKGFSKIKNYQDSGTRILWQKWMNSMFCIQYLKLWSSQFHRRMLDECVSFYFLSMNWWTSNEFGVSSNGKPWRQALTGESRLWARQIWRRRSVLGCDWSFHSVHLEGVLPQNLLLFQIICWVFHNVYLHEFITLANIAVWERRQLLFGWTLISALLQKRRPPEERSQAGDTYTEEHVHAWDARMFHIVI